MMKMKGLTVLLLAVLGVAVAQECPQGCDCNTSQGVMICTNIDALPLNFDPAAYTEFVFDNCNFQGELGKMPPVYSGAEQLHIFHCNVNTIAINAFENLSKLHSLSLRGNNLEFIDASTLFGLPNLISLDLQGNRITAIVDELFKFNPKLEKVIFNDNPLETIAKRAFAQPEDPDKNPEKMSKLKHIELENCNLHTVPAPALCMHSKVPNLVSLDLSRNNFSTLEDSLFKHTDGLQFLELDSCKLSTIGRETLGLMTKLKSLRLSNNHISSIDEQAFDDFFSTMEFIHLDYNSLSEAPYGLFNWATIQVLNISHNPWDCSCVNGWMQEYDIAVNTTDHNVTCASPEEHRGKNALHVMKEQLEPCEAPSTAPNHMIAVYVAIPIIVILSIITIIIIVKICILKKREARSRSAKYSLVYKPTTEKA